MQTNLDAVKNMAKALLYTDIRRLDGAFEEIYVHHPFISTTITLYNGKTTNILHDAEALKHVRDEISRYIDSATTPDQIVYRTNKPYRLTMLRFIKPYLSKKTFSHLLGEVWITTENPNQDINCPIPMLVQWFQYADKKELMDEEDFKKYKSLPEKIRVYRGVAQGRNPNGLSWTENFDKAEWFSKRFGDKGYIRSQEIQKEDVLAYFNGRGEEEIVCCAK